jgi:hypothetical protein
MESFLQWMNKAFLYIILFSGDETMFCLCQYEIREDGCEAYNWPKNLKAMHLPHTNNSNN